MKTKSRIAVLAVSALLLNLAQSLPASAKPYKPAGAQKEQAVAGSTFVPKAMPPQSTGTPFAPPVAVWPAQANVEVDLPDARGSKFGRGGPAQVTGLPVRVESSSSGGRLSVQAFGRAETAAKGVKGLLLRLSSPAGVTAPAGGVSVSVDYNAFRWAY